MENKKERIAAIEAEYEKLPPEDKAKVRQFIAELKANRESLVPA